MCGFNRSIDRGSIINSASPSAFERNISSSSALLERRRRGERAKSTDWQEEYHPIMGLLQFATPCNFVSGRRGPRCGRSTARMDRWRPREEQEPAGGLVSINPGSRTLGLRYRFFVACFWWLVCRCETHARMHGRAHARMRIWDPPAGFWGSRPAAIGSIEAGGARSGAGLDSRRVSIQWWAWNFKPPCERLYHTYVAMHSFRPPNAIQSPSLSPRPLPTHACIP